MKQTWSWTHVLIVAGTFLGTLHWYDRLPASIPVHWNFRGLIDGYGPRSFIYGIPVLMLLLQTLPALATRGASSSVHAITTGILAFFACLQAVIIAAAMGKNPDVIRLVCAGISLLIMFLGRQMPGLPRNYWVGIRTPWTLTSDYVWQETHRRAEQAMRWGGLAGAALTLTPWPWLGLIAAAGGVIYPVYDSWRISGGAPR